MKGRKPKSPAEKRQPVSFTGAEWMEILHGLDILQLDTPDDETRHIQIRWIEDRILARVVLPKPKK